jgi:hypothetical protein
MLVAASNTLPDNAGYVVAAYLVFLALVLIYVAIMAYKLARIGREVAELHALAEQPSGPPSAASREESHV